MLKSVEILPEDIKKICSLDVFGTRIEGYYNTYGESFDFCRVWVQYVENEPAAAVCDMSADLTVCANENADFDELAAFINMSDFKSLQCKKSVMAKLGLTSDAQGYVLKYSPCENFDEEITNNVDFKEIYDIIKAAGLMGTGDYLPWLSDVKYRVNHGTALPAAIIKDGKTVSCAMALFITGSAALLGAVATKEGFKGRGYAGRLVKHLGNLFTSQGKTTNLLCKNGSIVEFYKSNGFET
ncbi:MAG: GNAT family N-acetyltransferase, partial [Clostridia bacterium]|nr:GNAT family N-acetyltransferase [Clostridia bacterium]